jgi:hypothetical protein
MVEAESNSRSWALHKMQLVELQCSFHSVVSVKHFWPSTLEEDFLRTVNAV